MGRLRMPVSEVNRILRKNEFAKDVSIGSVKAFESNNIPSNTPMEDHHSEVQCLLSSGHLFGIFDGHGGEACSRTVSERLMKYIAAALLPNNVFDDYISNNSRKDLIKHHIYTNHQSDAHNRLQPLIHRDSFENYLIRLLETKRSEDFNMERMLEYAFLQLDRDMSNEALSLEDEEAMYVANSGTVACVVHVNDSHLHVANVGDCSAVLGTLTDDGRFAYEKLSNDHNHDNEYEVERILSEHPPGERHTIFRHDRLLGNLAPLRSLGDFKYKWSKKDIVRALTPCAVPQNYHTPPYLSGRPEVTYHHIRPRDKFLVIASDGLWDIMTPMEVTNVVGQHMLGKVYFTPFRLPDGELTLGEINASLMERKRGLMNKPVDENAATHLLRHALGGSEFGHVQDDRLSFMLSLSPEVSRSIRDDITITVIYFDTDYLANV